jgi:hypothetical protein
MIDAQILSNAPTPLFQPLRENGSDGLAPIRAKEAPQKADAPHALALLRPRQHRPRRRAPKPRDELPPPHP